MFEQGFTTAIYVLGTALMHFLWQGASLGAVYFVLRSGCRTAAGRYRLGMASLLILALAPVATIAYLWPGSGTTGLGQSSVPIVAAASGAATNLPSASWSLHAIVPWFVAAWFCGVLFIGLRSLSQWLRLLRLVSTATTLPQHWELRLTTLQRRFGLDRHVRLLSSAAVLTPMLIGWIKPVILLPASMLSGFSTEQLELIIAHELGHILRRDYFFNLLQVIIETVLFYHPVVHWISRDVRNAREECCDDLVLNITRGNRIAYARTLADLEELRQRIAIAVPVLGAGGGALLTRVRRIVGAAEAVEPLPRGYGWPLLLVLALVASTMWHPSSRTDEDFGALIAAVPGQAIALFSANPGLVVTDAQPLRVKTTLPAALAVSPPGGAASDGRSGMEAGDVPPPAVRISRPGVSIAGVSERLGDVVEPLAAMRTSLATPEAVIAPSHVVAPTYPPRAMAAGVEGSVELQFHVDSRGRVGGIHVLNAQPAGVFDSAARQALSQWLFPAQAGSTGLRTQKFVFSLRGNRHDGTDARCQSVTGTLICRHPGN